MGKKNRRTAFGESLADNSQSYMFYVDRLTELAISMFRWENLPETVDERFLELALFQKGSAVFFKDEVMGYLCLTTLFNGGFDVYNVPRSRRAYAVNGYQKQLNEDDSVIIFNNRLRTNSISVVKYYARQLWDMDRIMEVNVRAQKTPVFLQGTEAQRLTLLNLYKEYDGNQPMICGDIDLDIGKVIRSVRTDAPFVADKIQQLKTQKWNEALTYLGISNLSYQKKERMVSDEVIRNLGGTIANRYSRLQARRDAAEKINEMFGLEIEVNFREDFREQDDEFILQGESGDNTATSMVTDLRTNSAYPVERSGGGKNE